MVIAIGNSLSDLTSSDDEDDENTELHKLSEEDECSKVLGTFSKMVQQCMERFRQKQMMLDKLTQLGSGDSADYFSDSHMKYGLTKWMVLPVVKPPTDEVAATPAPITYGELMKSLGIIPRISHIPQGTSWPGSSQMSLGSAKPESNKRTVSLPPDTELDSSPIK